MVSRLAKWFDTTVLDLARQFRWSFVPPLMVYFAAGVSGLTSIVGTFFVKDYLGVSAAFLAGLTFWTGIPWILKMPLGHLVDIIWRRKALLVYLGGGLIALSLLIMYALIAHTKVMASIVSVETWFVLSAILSPVGYVVQDTVADAMTVEAVPTSTPAGEPYSAEQVKAMHTTMQMLGRFAIVSGLVIVAAINIFMFSGAAGLPPQRLADVYGQIYLVALVIPVLSVVGVILGDIATHRRIGRLRAQGLDDARIRKAVLGQEDATRADPWLLVGGLAFALFTIALGAGDIPFAQEIVFAGSMVIILVLIARLLAELETDQARALVGTAIIIFVFRSVPLPGPGQTWFEVDVLGFDQQFLSVLSLITSCLALLGMVVLRPLLANRSIAYVVGLLTIASGVLALPNIGLYYGVQKWTSGLTGGIVDARFIAIIDTAIESPLGQVAMIPMLAWIAQNAPQNLKATFFAVMASFTNLALSASSLATRYLNEIFLITRQVRDRTSDSVIVPADYEQLGTLLIVVAVMSVSIPLLTILLVQCSRWHTEQ